MLQLVVIGPNEMVKKVVNPNDQLDSLYKELIELNLVRDKVKPKESTKTEKRIKELNLEIRDIEHTMATKK